MSTFLSKILNSGPSNASSGKHTGEFWCPFVLVLQNSKAEEKKHRSPQGDKQTKETLLTFKIYLEIKVGFHHAKKKHPSLLMLPVKKSHQSKVIVAFRSHETKAARVCAVQGLKGR